MTREFRLMLAEQGAADPELAGRDVHRPASVSAAEAMREMAARAVERDKIDNRVRLDKTKHKSLTEWMNAQRAAYIRALPIPTDPRDAEIARLRGALKEVRFQLSGLVVNPSEPEFMPVTSNNNAADAECMLLAYDAARAALAQSGETKA